MQRADLIRSGTRPSPSGQLRRQLTIKNRILNRISQFSACFLEFGVHTLNRLFSSVAFGALLLASASAHAADPAAPASDAAPTAFAGTVEVGAIGRYTSFVNRGDLTDTFLGGAYGAFGVWGTLGAVRLGIDGYVEGVMLDEITSFPEGMTPEGLGVLGAHAGADIGGAYVGVFGAMGVYPEAGNEEFLTGVAAGLEAIAQVDAAFALFGRAGYAFAPTDDYNPTAPYPSHEGFIGPFAEIGATYALSDDLAVLGRLGAGYSDAFDRDGRPGGYVNWGAKLAYRLPAELNLNLVASYDGYYAYSTKEDEQNIEHTFKLGLSIPFGDSGTAVEALNPLATSVTPFRAGHSSDVL